jgi:hypothetical protein
MNYRYGATIRDGLDRATIAEFKFIFWKHIIQGFCRLVFDFYLIVVCGGSCEPKSIILLG